MNHAYANRRGMIQNDEYVTMYCQPNGLYLTRESGVFENQTAERYNDVSWVLVSKKKDHSLVRLVRDIGGVGYIFELKVRHVHLPSKNVETKYKLRSYKWNPEM